MKKLLIIILLLSNFIYANITDSFPKLSGRVVDNASLLNSKQKDTLIKILKQHEEQTSNQIVVLTLKSLDGYEIEEYSYQLTRHWAIGQKDKNNGVLLIISIQDRKLRIEVGYGLEGALTDKISHEIIEYILKPKFKQEQYYLGIQNAITEIITAIKGEYLASPIKEEDTNINDFLLIIFFAVIFISMLLNNLSKSLKHERLYKMSKSSLFASYSAIFSYVLSSEFTSYGMSIAIIVFILILGLSFFDKKKIDFNKIKKASKSTSSGYGRSSSGRSFRSSGSGFSGGGGSSGGGGASGGW